MGRSEAATTRKSIHPWPRFTSTSRSCSRKKALNTNQSNKSQKEALHDPSLLTFRSRCPARHRQRVRGDPVRGRVLASDGTPYPSASVTLKSHSGARTSPVYTDREGMFYVTNVAPGAYTLIVRTSRS